MKWPYVRLWLSAEIQPPIQFRPLHLQELTFKFELPLSRVFVSSTPRCGLSAWRRRWSGVDPARTLALPQEFEHWPLTMPREKLVKIIAKVVRHGRHVTFQLAEVAIPRRLFASILRLIDDLRPRLAPA